jgi:ion channel POLLUX/CASTOR
MERPNPKTRGNAMTLREVFRSTRFEIALAVAIALSVGFALASLFADILWVEAANLGFSLAFCLELGLRYRVARDRRRYWRTFWLDWIASIPWDILLILLLPAVGPTLAWTRALRLPRMARILRIVTVGRSAIGRRFAYHLKKQLEKDFLRQFFLLALTSAVILFLFGSLFLILGSDAGFGDPFFFSLLTLISSDSIFEVTAETPLFKSLTILLSFLGIVLFNGILIAILVTRITEYLENIREGRGPVYETGHLIVLGWHGLVPFLFRELDTYCETEDEDLTVVLQVPEIAPEIRDMVQAFRCLDVVLRRGLPYRQPDLEQISLVRGRAVLSLGQGRLSDHANVVIESYLTMDSMLRDAEANGKPWLLLNLPEGVVSRYLGDFSTPATTFDPSFYSAKILTSTMFEPDLYPVFEEIFGFEGSEFHFCPPGKAAGRTFGEIVGGFREILPMGLEREGRVEMIPPPDAVVSEDDRLVVLAETRGQALRALAGEPDAPAADPAPALRVDPHEHMRVLIIGVNPKVPFLLEELGKLECCAAIVDDQPRAEFERWFRKQTGRDAPEGLDYRQSGLKGREDLRRVLPLDRLDRVIVLADESAGDGDPGRIDADTLFKILKIRAHKAECHPGASLQILAEILSPDSEEAVQRIPEVRFVTGTKILGRLLCAYLVEPASEQILRQLVQLGSVDLAVADIAGDEVSAGFRGARPAGLRRGRRGHRPDPERLGPAESSRRYAGSFGGSGGGDSAWRGGGKRMNHRGFRDLKPGSPEFLRNPRPRARGRTVRSRIRSQPSPCRRARNGFRKSPRAARRVGIGDFDGRIATPAPPAAPLRPKPGGRPLGRGPASDRFPQVRPPGDPGPAGPSPRRRTGSRPSVREPAPPGEHRPSRIPGPRPVAGGSGPRASPERRRSSRKRSPAETPVRRCRPRGGREIPLRGGSLLRRIGLDGFAWSRRNFS